MTRFIISILGIQPKNTINPGTKLPCWKSEWCHGYDSQADLDSWSRYDLG